MPSHTHGLALLARKPTTIGFDWRDAFGIAHTGGKLVLNLFGAGALAAPLETLENREGILPEWAGGKPPEAPAAAPVVVPAPPKQDTAYWLAKLQERQQIAAGASRVDILKAKADAAGKMRDQLAALKRPVVIGAAASSPAPAGIADKATVAFVQAQLKALAAGTRNKALDPGPVDGLLGQATRAAVAAFNKTYGWPDDGTAITAGTLEALTRPDVRSFTNAAVADFTSEAGDVITAARPTAPAPSAFIAPSALPASAPAAAPASAPAAASNWPLWVAGGLTAIVVGVVIHEVRR